MSVGQFPFYFAFKLTNKKKTAQITALTFHYKSAPQINLRKNVERRLVFARTTRKKKLWYKVGCKNEPVWMKFYFRLSRFYCDVWSLSAVGYINRVGLSTNFWGQRQSKVFGGLWVCKVAYNVGGKFIYVEIGGCFIAVAVPSNIMQCGWCRARFPARYWA